MTKNRWLGGWLCLVLIFASTGWGVVAETSAAPLPGERLGAAPAQLILIANPQAHPQAVYTPPPAVFRQMQSATAETGTTPVATINITYLPSPTAWPPEARSAFDYAASIWETQIAATIPIEVRASWQDLSPYGDLVLGGAYAADVWRDFGNAPLMDTWYPNALANQFSGVDLDPGSPDIYALFNNQFGSWYFGTDGQPGPGRIDFVSVVLHELCHGLGFLSSFDVNTAGLGSWGDYPYATAPYSPYIYDRFIVNVAGESLVNTNLFPNLSTELQAQLTSGNLFFNGPGAIRANDGLQPELFAPATWYPGSSIAHLDESFNDGENRLMTYSQSYNEATHDPGPVALGVLTDIGWTVLSQPPMSLEQNRVHLPVVLSNLDRLPGYMAVH